MLKYYIQGLILGLTYVAPIGMQNLYVINSALTSSVYKAIQTALITVFFDVSLAIICFFGVGAILEKSYFLKQVILLVGAIIVIYIGISLIRNTPSSLEKVNSEKSFVRIAVSCFVVTWLNPQAIIDGSLLLGSFRLTLPIEASKFFIFGVCSASFIWFNGLAFVVNLFKKNFSLKLVTIINKVCGVIIIYYGLKLGYSFFKLI
ncbi:LysE/ArgO family amino acid transporter [Clostridium hydrogenum]|uniref:LysE/ArgO family amino acid transporter n=1 Tax=Clostridium hydrogenum TaxID=2855764 RepID=UPI001F337A75|nr:LysE family transporter [Clostridium hydrogenum]